MPHTSTVDIEIDAAPEAIFAWLAEPEKRLEWIEGLKEITPVTEDGVRVGACWIEIHDMKGREYEFEFEVTELEAPRRLRCTALARPQFEIDLLYIVETGLSANSLTIEQTTYIHGWFAKLMGGMLAKGLAGKLARDLKALKAAIEDT
ncbi:MAG TPA: SRPBCC family protein [Alphaproteobacteria bacterium]|nr:SRPBCC family protein [Alphaproteobacteria bacterium]